MAESVSEVLTAETREKRRRIAGSLWPRARLFGEILYGEITRDDLFTQAAALTYKTLFSLLPIFVLSLLVLSLISAPGGQSALDVKVKGVLFEQLRLNDLPLTDDNNQPVVNAEGKKVTLAHFAEQKMELIKNSVSGKATGLVAFGVLFYGAISLMIVIESTFNRVWGSAKARSWPRRIMLYWCVLTLGPIGVGASIVLGDTAYKEAGSFSGMVWVNSVVTLVSGFAVSWVLIFLLYKVVPETRVQWRPAVVGSFLAALAWEIGKWGFGMYTQWSLKGSYYGSIALLPLFMFWIYLTWIVVLMGLELTYMQQYWGLLKRQHFFTRSYEGRAARLSDLRWVLSLGVLLCKRFMAGQATQVDEAAEMLMLPSDVTNELFFALEKAGVVHRVSGGGYTLARPAEAITAQDLLAAARAMCEVPPELAKQVPHVGAYPQSAGLRELEELEARWGREHTLKDLAAGA